MGEELEVKEKSRPLGDGPQFSDLGNELLRALETKDFAKMMSLTEPYFPKALNSEVNEIKEKELKQEILYRVLNLSSDVLPEPQLALILGEMRRKNDISLDPSALAKRNPGNSTHILYRLLSLPPKVVHDSEIAPTVKALVEAGADLDAPELSSVNRPISELSKITLGLSSKLLNAAKKRDFVEMDRLIDDYFSSNSSNPDSKSSNTNKTATYVLYRIIGNYVLTDSQKLRIVKELVKAGADLNTPIPSNMPHGHLGSIVNLAINYKNIRVAQFLVKKGANVSILTRMSHTPFDLLSVYEADFEKTRAEVKYRALKTLLKPQPKDKPDLRKEYDRWCILFALTSILTFSASASLVAVSAASIKGKEVCETLLSSQFEFSTDKAHQVSNFFDQKSLGVPGVSIGVPLMIISMAAFFYAMSKLIETFAHNETINMLTPRP